MIKKKYYWVLHLFFCALFLSIPFFPSPENQGSGLFILNEHTWHDLLQYGFLVLFFYLNYLILIPQLYFSKKYIPYFTVIVIAMVLIPYLPSLLIHVEPPHMPPANGQPGPPPDLKGPRGNFFFARLNHNVFLFLAVAIFGLLLRIMLRLQQSEREKLTAELSYLKAQINPHFLFNSLNSIYSLAIQKSDNAPMAIQKLSVMMRYILSDAAMHMVPLQKELDYIKDYIEMQQLRFGEGLQLQYAIRGNTFNKEIAPLILIAFIENAFKYGVNAEEETDISIDILVKEKELVMVVTNKKVAIPADSEARSGIGLHNTKSRLELLYPQRHKLLIKDGTEFYTVNLQLAL